MKPGKEISAATVTKGIISGSGPTQDQNDPKLKAKFNMIEHFSKKIENDIQFFTLRIAKIPESRQKIFLEYRGLKNYRHYLERLFAESKHLLSEPEEKIMNLKSSTSYSNWVRMTSSFLVKEERKVLLENGQKESKPFPVIASLMNNKNRQVRDTAARSSMIFWKRTLILQKLR